MDYRDKVLNRAKTGLMDPKTADLGGHPVFYSSILFSMKQLWTDDLSTAAVDGRHLFINEKYFCSLPEAARVSLLAHESLHIALRHIDCFELYNRKVYSPEIEHRLYNEAGDHVINLGLAAAGYVIPNTWLCDRRFFNMATHEVYFILHDELDPVTYQPGEGDVIFCQEGDEFGNPHPDTSALQRDITTILTRARISANMAGEGIGNVPGGAIRTLDEMINPRLPFEVILANYMSRYAADDFSYRRPNRRFIPDFYLPGAFSEHICNLTYAFDLSGSVTKKQLTSFRNAVRIITDELRPELATLIQWDVELISIEQITATTDVMGIEFRGGGGTRVQPLIDWIRENTPEVTLVFTDGDFRKPDFEGVTSDIIWLIANNPGWTIEYGKVFHYVI